MAVAKRASTSGGNTSVGLRKRVSQFFSKKTISLGPTKNSTLSLSDSYLDKSRRQDDFEDEEEDEEDAEIRMPSDLGSPDSRMEFSPSGQYFFEEKPSNDRGGLMEGEEGDLMHDREGSGTSGSTEPPSLKESSNPQVSINGHSETLDHHPEDEDENHIDLDIRWPSGLGTQRKFTASKVRYLANGEQELTLPPIASTPPTASPSNSNFLSPPPSARRQSTPSPPISPSFVIRPPPPPLPATMGTLTPLPTPLLSAVFLSHLTDTKDFLSLCLVNRTCRSIVQDHLYADVVFEKDRQTHKRNERLHKFFKSIKRRPLLGEYIISLYINLSTMTAMIPDTLLAYTPNLKYLTLLTSPSPALSMLQHAHPKMSLITLHASFPLSSDTSEGDVDLFSSWLNTQKELEDVELPQCAFRLTLEDTRWSKVAGHPSFVLGALSQQSETIAEFVSIGSCDWDEKDNNWKKDIDQLERTLKDDANDVLLGIKDLSITIPSSSSSHPLDYLAELGRSSRCWDTVKSLNLVFSEGWLEDHNSTLLTLLAVFPTLQVLRLTLLSPPQFHIHTIPFPSPSIHRKTPSTPLFPHTLPQPARQNIELTTGHLRAWVGACPSTSLGVVEVSLGEEEGDEGETTVWVVRRRAGGGGGVSFQRVSTN